MADQESFLSRRGRRKLLSVVISQNIPKPKLHFSILLHQIKWQKPWSGRYAFRAQNGCHLCLLSIGKARCSPPKGFLHPEIPLEPQPAEILLAGELFWRNHAGKPSMLTRALTFWLKACLSTWLSPFLTPSLKALLISILLVFSNRTVEQQKPHVGLRHYHVTVCFFVIVLPCASWVEIKAARICSGSNGSENCRGSAVSLSSLFIPWQ